MVFDFTTALNEVLSSLQTVASTKELRIENRSTVTLLLNAERVRFKEILYNLLSNAAKFTPASFGANEKLPAPARQKLTISSASR